MNSVFNSSVKDTSYEEQEWDSDADAEDDVEKSDSLISLSDKLSLLSTDDASPTFTVKPRMATAYHSSSFFAHPPALRERSIEYQIPDEYFRTPFRERSIEYQYPDAHHYPDTPKIVNFDDELPGCSLAEVRFRRTSHPAGTMLTSTPLKRHFEGQTKHVIPRLNSVQTKLTAFKNTSINWVKELYISIYTFFFIHVIRKFCA